MLESEKDILFLLSGGYKQLECAGLSWIREKGRDEGGSVERESGTV